MAKYLLRLKAREMRTKGQSVKAIARELGVARSSASIWVRDIILTVDQLEVLRGYVIKGAELGRLRGALMQKERRLNLIAEARKNGKEALLNLTDREFLIAGIALYWGEGSRKKAEVSFCNSDPEMIKFLVLWLEKFFDIAKRDLRFCVGINEIHSMREKIVKTYWSQILNIPISQFNRTSFKKVSNKKVYKNFNEHYGTLRVRVLKSVGLHNRILGLIEGLKINMPG